MTEEKRELAVKISVSGLSTADFCGGGSAVPLTARIKEPGGNTVEASISGRSAAEISIEAGNIAGVAGMDGDDIYVRAGGSVVDNPRVSLHTDETVTPVRPQKKRGRPSRSDVLSPIPEGNISVTPSRGLSSSSRIRKKNKKYLDDDDLPPRRIFSDDVMLIKGTYCDASLRSLSMLKRIRDYNVQKFDTFNFTFVPEWIMRDLFPDTKHRLDVPISYRNTVDRIHHFKNRLGLVQKQGIIAQDRILEDEVRDKRLVEQIYQPCHGITLQATRYKSDLNIDHKVMSDTKSGFGFLVRDAVRD